MNEISHQLTLHQLTLVSYYVQKLNAYPIIKFRCLVGKLPTVAHTLTVNQ